MFPSMPQNPLGNIDAYIVNMTAPNALWEISVLQETVVYLCETADNNIVINQSLSKGFNTSV